MPRRGLRRQKAPRVSQSHSPHAAVSATKPPDLDTHRRLEARTRTFAEFLASVCRDAEFDVAEVFESGNVVDGPGWVFEATANDGVTFNVEVAGPAYNL
jgi:hypothetical protein